MLSTVRKKFHTQTQLLEDISHKLYKNDSGATLVGKSKTTDQGYHSDVSSMEIAQ